MARATLLALDRWGGENGPPPANRLMPLEPALGDADVLGAPKHLVGAVIQRPKRDADGNVLGGVRLPDVAVPLGVQRSRSRSLSRARWLVRSCPFRKPRSSSATRIATTT